MPIIFLCIQCCFVAVTIFVIGLGDLSYFPDSHSYVDGDQSLLSLLGSTRTPVYPLLLQLVEGLSPGLPLLALFQLTIYFCSVLVLYRGIVLAGLQPWPAAWIVSPLLWTHFLFRYAGSVMPDILAAASFILSAAMFLVLRRRPSWRAAVIFAFVTALTYLLKPMYLFLIVSFPAALCFLRLRETRSLTEALVSVRRPLFACVSLYLFYSLIRLYAVGHFGIVSYGGYNVSGIASQLLRPQTISRLDPANRPLAAGVLARHTELVVRELAPPHCAEEFIDRVYSEYRFPVDCFNYFSWRVTIPLVSKAGVSSVELNRRLTYFSLDILSVEWRRYIYWLAAAYWFGLTGALLWNPMLLVLLILNLGLMLWRTSSGDGDDSPEKAPKAFRAHLLTLFVFTFFPGLLLVVLVEPPTSRYVDPLSIFGLPLLAYYVYEQFCGAYNGVEKSRRAQS